MTQIVSQDMVYKEISFLASVYGLDKTANTLREAHSSLFFDFEKTRVSIALAFPLITRSFNIRMCSLIRTNPKTFNEVFDLWISVLTFIETERRITSIISMGATNPKLQSLPSESLEADIHSVFENQIASSVGKEKILKFLGEKEKVTGKANVMLSTHPLCWKILKDYGDLIFPKDNSSYWSIPLIQPSKSFLENLGESDIPTLVDMLENCGNQYINTVRERLIEVLPLNDHEHLYYLPQTVGSKAISRLGEVFSSGVRPLEEKCVLGTRFTNTSEAWARPTLNSFNYYKGRPSSGLTTLTYFPPTMITSLRPSCLRFEKKRGFTKVVVHIEPNSPLSQFLLELSEDVENESTRAKDYSKFWTPTELIKLSSLDYLLTSPKKTYRQRGALFANQRGCRTALQDQGYFKFFTPPWTVSRWPVITVIQE